MCLDKEKNNEKKCTQQSNNAKSVCTRVGLRSKYYHDRRRKHNNIDGDSRGGVERHVGIFGEGKRQ